SREERMERLEQLRALRERRDREAAEKEERERKREAGEVLEGEPVMTPETPGDVTDRLVSDAPPEVEREANIPETPSSPTAVMEREGMEGGEEDRDTPLPDVTLPGQMPETDA
ncbi:hypothetical protein KIPB_013437, partial [Kipferlia bialata]